MAMIACAECGKSISDRADACPQCGCPVGNLHRDLPGVQTTQKTSKPLKFLMLLALLAMFAGCIGYSSNRSDHELGGGGWLLLCLFGFASLVILQFVRWWHHG